MKKERSEAVVAEQTYYDFYCDKCGKFINTSMESENGDYYSFGKTKGKLKLLTESNKVFKLQFRAELCSDCYDSLVHELDTAIEGLLQKYGANVVIASNDDKWAHLQIKNIEEHHKKNAVLPYDWE